MYLYLLQLPALVLAIVGLVYLRMIADRPKQVLEPKVSSACPACGLHAAAGCRCGR